jgi:hypothetical protein
LDVASIDHGDHVDFNPLNLVSLTGVTYRVSATLGGRIELHADSPAGPLVSSVNIPPTGGAYTNISATFSDPGGTHNYSFVFLRNPGDSELFLLNWMEFQGDGVSLNQAPFGGVVRGIPGTIQAEDYDNGGEGIAYHDNETANNGGAYRPSEGVDIETTSDTGGGYDVGWTGAGEWIEYTVNVTNTGVYNLEVRYASPGSNGVLHVEFDGLNKTGPIGYTNTGGWQTWQSLFRNGIGLNAGQQVMRVSLDTNSPNTGNIGNLNYFRFTFVSNNTPPTVSMTNPVVSARFASAQNITLGATAADSGGSVSRVDFLVNGIQVGSDSTAPYGFVWTNVAAGQYTLAARAVDNVGLATTSSPVNITVTNGRAPFYGVPIKIPGLVQAEDFDGGGEGVAYHDSDISNNGNAGSYRPTSVDIEGTGDTGGGYNVGFTAGGEWMAYTVNAVVEGSYSLAARVASSGNAGTFHIEIDGTNRTGTITVNDTGNWQVYTNLTTSNIFLRAGLHDVRIAMDTSGGNGTVGNYNYLNFTVTSTNPPPVLQSTVALPGVFADEPGATVSQAARTVTIPITTSVRFYRLRGAVVTRISSAQVIGSNLVMTYE